MREVWKSVLAFLKILFLKKSSFRGLERLNSLRTASLTLLILVYLLFHIVNSSRLSMKKILRKKPPKSAAVR